MNRQIVTISKDRTSPPRGWTWLPIGSLAREIRERAGDNSGYPVLSVTKHRGIVRADDYHKKTVHGRDTSNYKVVRLGQFAYATIHLDEGSIGILECERAGIVSPMYTVFEVVRDIEPFYLLTLLKSNEALNVYGRLAEGTVNRRASIGFDNLGTVSLLLPPLPEQRKIAAILSAVDAVIERTQAVIDQLQQVKKALMQELLTRGIPGRHTRFKKTEIGEVPEGWEISTVGQSCVLHNNLRKPIETSERERNPGPYPYYGPTKILSHINEFMFDGEYALIGEDGDHFLKFDKWSMTQLARGRFNVNNHAHVLSGTDRCATQWFFQYFKHRDIVQNLTRQGAGRYKLRKSTLVELPIPIPSVDEQLFISSLIDTAESRISSEEATVQRFITVRAALMSVLLSGEVRVKVEEGAA